MKWLRELICFLGVVAFSPGALAWGRDGHLVTGYIAERLLTPTARVRLSELAPAQSLGELTTWMDEQRIGKLRRYPQSSKWHYDNIPICHEASYESYCGNSNCASFRLNQYLSVLADSTQPRDERTFALRIVVHLLGDIHQPLHASDNDDRGGNDIQVGRGENNLHKIWDSGIVGRLLRGTNAEEYAPRVLDRFRSRVAEFEEGTSDRWIAESHQISRRVAYGGLPGFSCSAEIQAYANLPKQYMDDAALTVELQLVRAGVRIARVMNNALGRPHMK